MSLSRVGESAMRHWEPVVEPPSGGTEGRG